MTVPPLTLRLEKGSPLTSEEHDSNLKTLRDFADGLARLFEVVFNADGTLKNDTIGTAALLDRAVTQPKLDWLANFFGVASGVDNYSVTISPNTGFSYGDGVATAFFCLVKFTNANTGAATLDVNTGGAKAIKKFGGSQPLIGGDIAAGAVIPLIYDGTEFQMLSPESNPAGSHGLQVIGAGAGNFTVPVGVYVLEVECVGGGGGGGLAGGGGGGYAYKRLAVTPGDVIAYVVGAGGIGTAAPTNGGDTTFNATIIGGGGKNGKVGDGDGVGGTASGGDLNCPGAYGSKIGGPVSDASQRSDGGMSGRAMGFGGMQVAAVDVAPSGYGGGGYGDYDPGGGFTGGPGGDGVLIIRW